MIGLDSSPEMVEAARARGIDAFVADAEAMDLERFGQFDAVFSNAALHWMLDPDAVATRHLPALRDRRPLRRRDGRRGQSRDLAPGAARRADRARLSDAGAGPGLVCGRRGVHPALCLAGFDEIHAELIARPTPLPGGVAAWVKTFRAGLMDVAMVPEWERDDVAAAVEARSRRRCAAPTAAGAPIMCGCASRCGSRAKLEI